MLERPNTFTQTGRSVDLEESLNIDEAIIEMFKEEKVPFFQLRQPDMRIEPLYEAVEVAFEYIDKRKRRNETSS